MESVRLGDDRESASDPSVSEDEDGAESDSISETTASGWRALEQGWSMGGSNGRSNGDSSGESKAAWSDSEVMARGRLRWSQAAM